MTVDIERKEIYRYLGYHGHDVDEEMKQFPYFWMISRGGTNCGHGWSATEARALQDAFEYVRGWEEE